MTLTYRMWGTALALLAGQGVAMAAIGPEAAQELTHKSGLWVQLESLGAQVQAGMTDSMAKNPGQLSDVQKSRMLACAQSAYAADGLRSVAVDAVSGTLQPDDVAPLMAWYDSALGRKIAAAEEASSAQAVTPQERLQRGGAALAKASESRKASLNAILVETHSVEMMADTLIEMAYAVQQGTASLDPATTPAALSELKANLASHRPQLLQHYAQISLPAYAFTYGSVGDDDLKQYADHLSSPSAKAFNDGSTRGVARALGSGSVKLGRCLKEAGAKS
jgi:hypothetical protein